MNFLLCLSQFVCLKSEKRNRMQTLSNFHDLILCFISTLEARDLYISHYSSRVAEITEKI